MKQDKSIDAGKLAQLTNIPLTQEKADLLSAQFESTIEAISTLNELNTNDIEATPQVTSLSNVTRPDVIDTSRTFTQQQALQNAKQTHRGYFVVKAVINES